MTNGSKTHVSRYDAMAASIMLQIPENTSKTNTLYMIIVNPYKPGVLFMVFMGHRGWGLLLILLLMLCLFYLYLSISEGSVIC